MTATRLLTSLALLLGATACAPPALVGGAAAARASAGPAGLRVHHTATGRDVSLADMVAAAAAADVVFFGEMHDDAETHFAEFALLEGIGRRRDNVVVSLEMFERDVQPLVDDYLAGRISETDFLARSRPWERYATDYRALVLLARARGWPVIASNIPRPIASSVARRGLSAVGALPADSAWLVAREHDCTLSGEYYRRFGQTMSGHGGPGTAADSAAARAITDRYYESQCAKDEAMAEAIAEAHRRAGAGAVVVHFNGAFHSDFGLGTAERVRRRMPQARMVVISALPVADPQAGDAAANRARGDFLVFTRRFP
jgi:uncharacterized iron-regulated protein